MSTPERDYEYDAHAAWFDDCPETGSEAAFDPACPAREKTTDSAWACAVRGCPHRARHFTDRCDLHHKLLLRRGTAWLCRRVQVGVWVVAICIFLLLRDPEPVVCLWIAGGAAALWLLAGGIRRVFGGRV